MKRALLLAALLLAPDAAACGPSCRTNSQCSAGEHCDFVSGDCVHGCASDRDCESQAHCNTRVGNCVPRAQAGGGDARTSTVAPDSGAPDAADAAALD